MRKEVQPEGAEVEDVDVRYLSRKIGMFGMVRTVGTIGIVGSFFVLFSLQYLSLKAPPKPDKTASVSDPECHDKKSRLPKG